VKFSIDQAVPVDPDRAATAYATPAFYEGRAPRDNISVLEVAHYASDGDRVSLDVRFRFSGAVSGAVRAVVDPKKMCWVTQHRIDLAARHDEWTIVPDHYPDRLSGRGQYRFAEGADGADSAVVTLEGELSVHVPLVGRTVERVIVSGLRSYFGAEVTSIPDQPAG
jgi:hypothetical protein